MHFSDQTVDLFGSPPPDEGHSGEAAAGLGCVPGGVPESPGYEGEANPQPMGAPTEYLEVPTAELLPCPWPVRFTTDPAADAELEASITQQGILNPILVRRTDSQLEIVAGMRRWSAAGRLRLARVPVRVYTLTDEQARAVTLLENGGRLGLSIWEESRWLLPLLHRGAELQETLILKEVCAITGWSIGKASSRRKIALRLTPEILTRAEVADEDATCLPLRVLEDAADAEPPDARAAVLYRAVHGRAAPWIERKPGGTGGSPPVGVPQRSYTFRSYAGGERLSLTVRPGSITAAEQPGVRRVLLLLLDALGPAFADLSRLVEEDPSAHQRNGEINTDPAEV